MATTLLDQATLAAALQECALRLRTDGWRRESRWAVARLLEHLAYELDPESIGRAIH